MLDKYRVYWKSRRFLYLLNAYTDAFLARELVNYSRNQNIHDLEHPRVKRLVKAVGGDPELALGLAYCQYYFNGWFDYIYGRLFGRAELKLADSYCQELGLEDPYGEVCLNTFWLVLNLIRPLWILLWGRIPRWENFVGRFKLVEERPNKRVIVRACCVAQRENVKSNRQTIESFGTKRTTKLEYINKFVEESKDKPTTLRAIKKTLEAASFWDKLFSMLLRARFPHYFV